MTHDQANQAFADRLHTLHDEKNEAFARRLLNELPAMRGKLGYISQAIETPSGRPLVPVDAAGITGQGGDIGNDQDAGFRAGEGKVGHK